MPSRAFFDSIFMEIDYTAIIMGLNALAGIF